MLAAFTTAYAQETVTVYDGTNTNSYVPVYGTWADAYNKCEFIMNAEQLTELPAGSTLTGLKWYLSSPTSKSWQGNFMIFIKEVDVTTLSDYIGSEGATIVYEGPLDGTSGALDLEFSNYYTYEGGNMLIGVYETEKGVFTTGSFLGISTEGASVGGYNSSSIDQCTATQRNFVPKTTFTYQPSGGAVYYKPKNLQVSNITPNSATLTWEAGGNETAWNVEYKKAADEEWTSAHVTSMTYALDALANGTNYDVRVQADYGDGNLSGWLNGTFQTPICEESEMGEVAYVLTDSYGDRWASSEFLQVVYNGTVVATINWPSNSENKYEYTGSINLCYGVDYQLVWNGNGNYTYECGFKLTAPDGSVIYEHVGGTSGNAPTPGTLTTFQINEVSCSRPTELAASDIVYNGAKLTWTPGDEEQDAWEVVYGVAGFNPDEATPVAVSGEATYTITGLTENTGYTAYVRGNCGENDKSNWSDPINFTTSLQFPIPSELAVSDITTTTAKATWTGEAENYNLRYRKAAAKEVIFSDDFENGLDNWTIYTDGTAPQTNGWYAFNAANSNIAVGAHGGSYVASAWSWSNTAYDGNNWLITPQVTFGDNLSFWVTTAGNWPDSYEVLLSTSDNAEESFTVTLQAMAAGPTNNLWNEVVIDLSEYKGQTGYIAIHHVSEDCNYLFIDDFSIYSDAEADEWTVVENTTSPYNFEGLTPATEYEVQVQGVYTDGTSQWTESVNFTTSDGLDVPTELAVNDVTYNSAVASWEGSQEAYNLRYRKAYTADVKFFEGFEEGLDAWTLVNTDGDNYNWQIINPETAFSNATIPNYEGSYCVMSRSYVGGAITPDQWMISPQIEDLGGLLRYYIMDDGGYPETYRIYVSTTDTEIASFTEVTDDLQSPSSSTWTERTVDLSAYAGQAGYIAFRHYNCTDQDFMFIDAIGIYANEVPAGEWTVVENVTSPFTIEGLDPETEYEVEVQGIFGENTTEWTAPVNFTTLEAPAKAYYLIGTFNEWDPENMIPFVEEDGVFTLTYNFGGEFKIKDEAGNWWGGGVTLTEENPSVTLVDGNNLNLAQAAEYTLTIEDGVLTVTGFPAPQPVEYSEFYVVGSFNGWKTEEGEGRVELTANEDVTEFTGTVELAANDEFKIITPIVTGGWKWFGGESENGDFFLVNSDMLGINISLIDGSNFKVEEGGEYTITVKAYPEDKGISEPLAMVITKNAPQGIDGIYSDMKNDNAWYGVNGVRYERKPVAPGIYIHNGKKVVIK